MRTSTRRYVATGTALIGAVLVGAFVGPHLVRGGPADTSAVTPAPAATTPAAAVPRSEIPEASTALRDLAALPVSDAYVASYSRAAFGPAWADTDHNGCDTRNDVLRADLTAVTVKPGTNGCVVLSGTLSDPYTGRVIQFARGYRTSELVPIDHVVPLGYSWQHGAATWTPAKREQFANDLAELQPVDEASNTAKSDSGPADWMPQNAAYRCTYDTRWVQILTTYRLSIDTADKTSIDRTLTGCL
jgi:hypothetical protein